MTKALLIIDVQVSSVTNADVAKRIEKLQYDYDNVFVSLFSNKNSPLLKILQWKGYENESLAFTPKESAVIFNKIGYSSFLPEMKKFDEIYLCGFDTDACIYKTAMDLVENNICPVILKDYCFSANEKFHKMALELIERNIGKHNIM
ncbi:MAG: isochorismatase family protein [Alphaproteobacteria bacterium]|nr:isochorismatase family protein [Alphaproteobacteria bacterium]